MKEVADPDVSSSRNEEPAQTSRIKGPRAKRSCVRLSRARDIAVSVLIIGILMTAVLSSVPNSALKTAAAPFFSPVARATGLDQSWGMFSPDPPRTFSLLEVHVVMDDGQDRIWLINEDPSMPGLYWRKIKEEVIKHKEFRAGLAFWVLRKMTKKGERPARIAMLVKTETLPLKGEVKRTNTLIFDRRFPQSKANPRASANPGVPS
jgi:hypothetical protein